MANEKGHILNKEFENGIAGRMVEIQKDMQGNIDKAQDYVYEKNDDVEAMIKEHPKSFVVGAFVGGVALGTLLSRGSK